MMSLLSLAIRSLFSRKTAVLLSTLSIALSVMLFLGIDKLRRGASAGFDTTISGTDLIVGARSGSVNLLLYSVFRIGDPTNNLSWSSYEDLSSRPEVAWTIPLSLGDSHGGFRVIGTTRAYLDHYRYGSDRSLYLTQGRWFDDESGAVLGAEAARALGYDLGNSFPISHGTVSVSFAEHEGHEFSVVGILQPTGTPVDRAIHVSLAGLEEVHEDTQFLPAHAHSEAPHAEPELDPALAALAADDPQSVLDAAQAEADAAAEQAALDVATPDAISAFLVGLENRRAVLSFQRAVNQYSAEPLSAVIPAVALDQLWTVVGTAERTLVATAAFVVLTGLLSLLIAILTSLSARRREIAVLRAAGAGPRAIFFLLLAETLVVASLGAVIGAVAVYGLLGIAAPIASSQYGIPLAGLGPSTFDAAILLGVIALAAALGLIPAWRAHQNSLEDGLSIRL